MRALFSTPLAVILALGACDRPPLAESEEAAASQATPTLAASSGRHTVVVNPNANGNGVAATIQEGIDMVESGGTVMIKPGTYPEVVLVTKGVTLLPLEPNGEPVIIQTPASSIEAVEIMTGEPVVIRGLQVHASGNRGIFGFGPVDLTVEGVTVLGAAVAGIGAWNNDPDNAGMGRLVIRDSRVIMLNAPTGTYGIFAGGDLNSLIEGNHVESPGAMCIEIRTRSDGGGSLSGSIRGNTVDRCGIAGAIRVDRDISPGVGNPPFTTTGTVDILDNVIRNSTASCSRSAIFYEVLSGRIEGNDATGYVQPCATGGPRILPAAIIVGSRFPMPAATPLVRGNDVGGNAFAGLRLSVTATTAIDASCNWWGDASGPAGIGGGAGAALLLEAGAVAPTYLPFATAPIAQSGATGC